MKKIIAGALALAMCMSMYIPIVSAAEVKSIYVDVNNGNDSGTGSIDSPFKSIERGLKELSKLKNSISEGTVEVILREGIYNVDKTVEINSSVSGTDNVQTVLKGYDGEYVKLTPAKKLPNDKIVKVSDNAILERIPEAARDKIYSINLNELGYNIKPVYEVVNTKGGNNGRNLEFYWNDKMMTLGRWPNNGEYAKIKSVTNNDASTDSMGFIVKDDRIKRWGNAKNPQITGFFMKIWQEATMPIKSINTETQEIVTNGYHSYGVAADREYYVFNLLEEIDVPGEYYYDSESGIMYMYPDGDVNSGDLQFAYKSSDKIVAINGVNNFTLKNIVIGQSTGNGITVASCNNVRIENCKIFGLGGEAVNFGYAAGCSTNCTVYGCEIYDLGRRGITIYSGDANTLTPGNIVVENNHIYNFANRFKTYEPAVYLAGVGNKVIHNVLHDAPHQIIHFGGNENEIAYNEIYDACKESADAGLIYGGRSFTARNYIHNNLFHSLGGHQVFCIYCDDMLSGTQIENNVFVDVIGGIAMCGGRWASAKNNLFIGKGPAGRGADITMDERGTTGFSVNVGYYDPDDLENSPMVKLLREVPYKTGIWKEKYPWLENVLEDDAGYPKYNTVQNNVFANSGKVSASALNIQYGEVSNNYEIGNISYEMKENHKMNILEPEQFDNCTGFKLEKLELDKIGVYGDGNYTIPQQEYVKVVADDVNNSNMSGQTAGKPLESTMRENSEIYDIAEYMRSNTSDWDSTVGKMSVLGNEIRVYPGKVGYVTNIYDNVSSRLKYKLGKGVSWIGIELRAGTTNGMPWGGGKSYLYIMKPDRLELQRWNGTSEMLEEKANPYYKSENEWINVEMRSYTGEDKNVYLKVRINGETVFDKIDSNQFVNLKEPGHIAIIVSGDEDSYVTIGEFDKQYEVIESDEETEVKEEKTESNKEEKLSVSIKLDGKKMKTSAEPFIKNDRVMIPMRDIFESLGAMVDWNDDTRRVISRKDNKRIVLEVDNPVAYINGVEYVSDAVPEISQERTMIGVRFVAQALGAKVDWDAETYTVIIETPEFAEKKEEMAEGDSDGEDTQSQPGAETGGQVDDAVITGENNKADNTYSSARNFDKTKLVSHNIEEKNLTSGLEKRDLDKKEIDSIVSFNKKEDSYYIRGGIPNFAYKLKETNEQLNVAFIGGSITEGAYYREYMCNWLRETYGNRFNFTNAGYGGTGSGLAQARYYYDIISKNPDLVFIEFAVNDTEALNSALNMESMVRQTWNFDNTIDIVFVYTVQASGLETAVENKYTPVAKAQDYIARNYQIPSVFMGTQGVMDYKEGKIAWSERDNPDKLKAFTKDGTHPTDEGSRYYFEELKEAFEKMLTDGEKLSQEPAKYLAAKSTGEVRHYSPSEFGLINKKTSSQYEIWKNRTDEVYMLSNPGDSVTIEFTGTECGILVITGGDCCMVDVEADGKKTGSVDIFMPYHGVTTYGLTSVSSGYLGAGKHTVTFSVSSTIQDKADRIKNVTNNLAQIELIKNTPEFYGLTNLIIGSVWINGEKN